jgi:hypothetical protein
MPREQWLRCAWSFPVPRKTKHVHFVGGGGADLSREQGPVDIGSTGCDRPRMEPTADCDALIDVNGLQ